LVVTGFKKAAFNLGSVLSKMVSRKMLPGHLLPSDTCSPTALAPRVDAGEGASLSEDEGADVDGDIGVGEGADVDEDVGVGEGADVDGNVGVGDGAAVDADVGVGEGADVDGDGCGCG
jgi:UDP-3-O-[3-hydroxymyristoyl] glucosamine N-acyltransferase